MYPKLNYVKSILVKENYITEADSVDAEAHATDAITYVEYLIKRDLLTKPLLGQALAESYNLPYADLENAPPQKQYVELIPEQIARANRARVIANDEHGINVATDSPNEIDSAQIKALFPSKQLTIAYTLPEAINEALRKYELPLVTQFSEIIKGGNRVAPEIVEVIVSDALSLRASDIHFEPQKDSVYIRMRVDGTLRLAGELPRENYENILNRIKIESGMRIDEHFSAQDGALQMEKDEGTVTLRVSLLPTVYGEKIVMRVLGSYVQGYTLREIGMLPEQQEALERYARKPFGMILVVGPTGSGKTTTLYSLIKILNSPNVNITSIEDPVEYRVDGVNQIQVQEQTNLTFSRGLRSIVRQDPDVILVGEIRDMETAEISTNAALTGHLLLSTFHANDAATAIPRLIDMGIEPFLLSSALEVVIAQRLVRKLCTACKYSIPAKDIKSEIPGSIVDRFSDEEFLYKTKGCAVCNDSGYVGRTALFEFINVDGELQDLIVKSPSAKEIQEMSHRQNNNSLLDDGIVKIKRGLTSIEEVLRVVDVP